MRRSKSDRAAADGRIVALRSRLMWCLYWCVYGDAAERSWSGERLPRLVRAFADVIAERRREPVPEAVPPKKWGRTLVEDTGDGMDEFEAAQVTAKATKASRRLAAENAGYTVPALPASSRKAFHQDAPEGEDE